MYHPFFVSHDCDKFSFHNAWNGYISINVFMYIQIFHIIFCYVFYYTYLKYRRYYCNLYLAVVQWCSSQNSKLLKNRQQWVFLKTPLHIQYHIPILNWLQSKSDFQVMPCSQKKKSWFYLHLLESYNSNKVKINAYKRKNQRVTSNSLAKIVMIFGFLVSRAFQRYVIWMISQ